MMILKQTHTKNTHKTRSRLKVFNPEPPQNSPRPQSQPEGGKKHNQLSSQCKNAWVSKIDNINDIAKITTMESIPQFPPIQTNNTRTKSDTQDVTRIEKKRDSVNTVPDFIDQHEDDVLKEYNDIRNQLDSIQEKLATDKKSMKNTRNRLEKAGKDIRRTNRRIANTSKELADYEKESSEQLLQMKKQLNDEALELVGQTLDSLLENQKADNSKIEQNYESNRTQAKQPTPLLTSSTNGDDHQQNHTSPLSRILFEENRKIWTKERDFFR